MSRMAEDPTAKQPHNPDSAADPDPAAAAPPAAAEASSTAAVPPPVPVAAPDTGYTPGGVPTLEGVREKIETRFGTALGATELAEETPEGRTAAQQFDARQKAAEDKLEKIRASMHKPSQS